MNSLGSTGGKKREEKGKDWYNLRKMRGLDLSICII
jgi:hypothetical protein